MNQRQHLDTVSRNLFFSGLIVSRFNNLHIPIISACCFLVAGLLYLGGYATWLMSINNVQSSQPHIADALKAQFEREFLHINQYLCAALLGIAASIALMISLVIPLTFGLISCWLFLSSNVFWWWAEHIAINRLRDDKPESPVLNAREKYYTYTALATINSAVIAISLSLYCFIPALTMPLGLVVSTFLLGLNIHTFHYWVKSAYANAMLTEDEQEIDAIELSLSYTKLQSRTDFTPSIEEECSINLITTFTPQNIELPNTKTLSSEESSLDVPCDLSPLF